MTLRTFVTGVLAGLGATLPGIVVHAQAAGAPAAEAGRVQAFLNNRYTQTDVRSSFHTKFGETVDCIDYFAQPGVKMLAARGTPITRLPPPTTKQILPPALADFAFLGQPDDQGHPRACPPSTVPILRISPSDVARAGGLDAFLAAHDRKARPHGQTSAMSQSEPPFIAGDGPGYAHVFADYTYDNLIYYTASYANIFIWNPPVDVAGVGDHSLAQVWVLAPGTAGEQSVEVGWNVDPDVYPGDGLDSHLFIYSTVNGWVSPPVAGSGCYNDVGQFCEPWVTEPGAGAMPGMALPNSTWDGSRDYYLQLSVEYVSDLGNGQPGWQIDGLGGYPSANFNGDMQTQAWSYQVGGEVFDHRAVNDPSEWMVPMGSGSAPTAPGVSAGMFENIQVYAPYYGWIAYFNRMTCTVPTYYCGDYFGSGTSNGTYGPLANVWAENYGSQWSPVGNWAPYSTDLRGECPLGIPVTGLSATPAGTSSYAIQCGQWNYTPPSNGTTCYQRNILYGDNRGYNEGDWDVGYVKAECAGNEYVQGVAQTASGYLDAVLCCPGTTPVPDHYRCGAAEVTYAESAPSFDPQNLDASCTPGNYVAGVSRQPNGAVHRILCCSSND